MKTFEYAKTKKEKKKFKMPTVKIGKYDFYIWAFLFFPIIFILLLVDKIHDWSYNRLKWSEEKAKKVLDYWLPYVLSYDDGAYWYCTSWHYPGWQIAKRAPIGLKKWTKKFGYELRDYLEKGYEKDGFDRTIIEEYWDEHWIKFTPKN